MNNLEQQIEEAAERLAWTIYDPYADISKKQLIELAKESIKSPEAKAYHTQGKYSEEEVLNFLSIYRAYVTSQIQWNSQNMKTLSTLEWFNQNKKK